LYWFQYFPYLAEHLGSARDRIRIVAATDAGINYAVLDPELQIMFWPEEETMRHLLTIAFVAVAFVLPQRAEAQDTRRFPEFRPDQLTPEQKTWAEGIALPPRNAKFTNFPYRAYIHSPELAVRLQALSDYGRWNTPHPARLSEFAILITARQWSSQWIWRGHYPLALKGGLDPKVALELASGKRPEGMKEDEAILYDLAMQIYRDKAVTDAAYDAALAKFGERGIMDLLGIMGYYDTVAMILITAKAVPPKADIPQLQPLTR
jgi:4-carboxymuconolactone decarboxylase